MNREDLQKNMIPVIASTITSLTVILSAAFLIDSRYAHADAVEKQQSSVNDMLKQNQLASDAAIKYQTLELKQQTLLLRRSIIEDKLFELDIKRESDKNRRLAPVDEAQYSRYSRQLLETNNQLSPNH